MIVLLHLLGVTGLMHHHKNNKFYHVVVYLRQYLN